MSGSFTDHGQGQLSSQSQTVGGVARTVSLTCDLHGGIETIICAAGFTVTYERNNDGQVTAINTGEISLATGPSKT